MYSIASRPERLITRTEDKQFCHECFELKLSLCIFFGRSLFVAGSFHFGLRGAAFADSTTKTWFGGWYCSL